MNIHVEYFILCVWQVPYAKVMGKVVENHNKFSVWCVSAERGRVELPRRRSCARPLSRRLPSPIGLSFPAVIALTTDIECTFFKSARTQCRARDCRFGGRDESRTHKTYLITFDRFPSGCRHLSAGPSIAAPFGTASNIVVNRDVTAHDQYLANSLDR